MPDEPMTVEKANALLQESIPEAAKLPHSVSSGVVEQPDISPQAEPAVDAIEAEARKEGWLPEGEYTGKPTRFMTAREFLFQQPLKEKLRHQSKMLDAAMQRAAAAEQKATLAHQIGYQKAIQDLQARKDQAISEGNVTQVHEIDTQIDQHRMAQAQALQPAYVPPPLHPDIANWVSRNSWFNMAEVPTPGTDQELTNYAKSLHDNIHKSNPGPIPEELKQVDIALRKLFPHKFSGRVNTPEVEPSNGSTPPPRQRGLKASDLSDDERAVMKNMIASGAKITEAEYLKQLEAIRGGR